MRPLILLLVAAACGDNIIPQPHSDANGRSGTRLEVQWTELDGTWLPSTTDFFDADLGMPCTSQRWLDGEWRCNPLSGEIIFTDANCTSMAGRSVMGEVPPDFFTVTDVSSELGFVGVSAMFRRGELPVTADQTFRRTATGDCIENPDGDFEYWAFDGSVRRDRLATLFRNTGGGIVNLFAVEVDSDDGMHVRAGVSDRRGFDCLMSATQDGQEAYCLPPAPRTAELYLNGCFDAIAAEQVVHVVPTSPFGSPGSCPFYGFPSIDPLFVGPNDVFRQTPNGCEPTSFEPGTSFYYLSQDTAVRTRRLPLDDSDSRYQHIIFGTGTTPVVGTTLFDTEANVDCRPDAATGTCTPEPWLPVTTAYTSDDCDRDSRIEITILYLLCDLDQQYARRANGERVRVGALRTQPVFVRSEADPDVCTQVPTVQTAVHLVDEL